MRCLLPIALLLSAAATAAPCPTRASWPTTAWPSRAEAVKAARAKEIEALEAYAFTLTGADAAREGIRTDGVLIVHRGEIVYERYARGFDEAKRHLAWSVTKSATNALAGVAVARGAVTLDDSICDHLKPTRADLCGITVRHLLEFSSGLDWKETYENESNQKSSVLAMLYGEGRRDMAAFVTSHRLRDPPGETWAYSSGDTTLLSSVLDEAMKKKAAGADWPHTLLFDRLGMGAAILERDGRGHPVGSSYLYATPRDLARLGWFYLSDGCWEGQRVLPEGWVAESIVPSAPLKARALYRDPGDVQGRQFWLNRAVPELQPERPWPDAPEEAYAMRGHWGQSVTIIPSLELVIVRVADDRKKAFELNTFLPLAMAVAK